MRSGVALVGTCLLLWGCNQPTRAPAAYAPPIENRGSEVGRYAIDHAPNTGDTRLLDTVTGHSWQLIEANGELSWKPIAGSP